MRQFIQGVLRKATSQRTLRARHARHALDARLRVGRRGSALRCSCKLIPVNEAPFSLWSGKAARSEPMMDALYLTLALSV